MTRYHHPMIALRLTLVAALVVVAGCSTVGGSPSRDPGSLTPASIQPSLVPALSPATTPGTNALPNSITDPVVADIARLAGVPVDQVTIVSAESVTFPNAGLGCPEPGMVYAQVMVEGYKVIATVGGKTYDYRGTAPGKFRQCTNPG